MKLISLLAALGLFVAFASAQSSSTGYFDSKGKWHAPKQSRPKQSGTKSGRQPRGLTQRDLDKLFKENEYKPPKQRKPPKLPELPQLPKPPKPPKPPKGSQPSTEFRPGYHQEYKYFPGHVTPSGKFVEGTWRWVWVKDSTFDLGGGGKRRKSG